MAKLKMFHLTLFLFIIGYFIEAGSTYLQISGYTKESNSECTSAFLHGNDRYIYNGAINTTDIDISKRRIIIFEMQRSSSNIYDPICTLNIYTANCSVSSLNGCYCKSNTSFLLDVILNVTANVQYSNSTIQLRWPDLLNGFQNISNIETVPVIQTDFVEELTIDGTAVNLNSCNAPTQPSSVVKWCVKGLSSHTLKIVSDQHILSEGENCANYTFNNSSLTSFTVSFNEPDYCQRNRTHICFFIELTTTIPTTVNTTNATTAPCSSACIAVIVCHAVCTVLEAIITIIIIVILSEETPQFVTISTCIALTTLELVQIALVIVNGESEKECKCETTVPLWGIMLIYQFISNYCIFIVVDVVYLVIKISCKTSEFLEDPWIAVVIFICIHSVIGIPAIPIVLILKCTNKPKKITGDVPLKDTTRIENDKVRASNRDPKTTKEIHSHSNAINPEIESNTESSAAPSNGEERSKRKKKKSKRSKRPHKDNTENDATRSASGVEVHFKESEYNSGKIKRPPSVEITNNPNPITPRPLPQSRAVVELPPIRNK